MNVNSTLQPKDLVSSLSRVFELAAKKVCLIDRTWDASRGTPVFTVEGKYTTRGWTEWTQGFQHGCAILAFDATDEQELLDLGRRKTVAWMAPHVTHTGVHDHGFNNISTYGNLRRLMREGRMAHNEWEMNYYELALKASGAVQASRWSGVPGAQDVASSSGSKLIAHSKQLGYIYSFNGPHSLFVDTMRTLRILSLAWQLGHVLVHENDRRADLLKRCVLHALCTNRYLIFHGDSIHTYDVRGRTAHEAIFNRNDSSFRNRSTQQGYSPFSTWTRGLAWAILGYAEQLEFLATIPEERFADATGLKKSDVVAAFEQAAIDTGDHYIDECAAADGVCYWDNGAPNLDRLADWRSRPAEPFNDYEPVDSSASAIAAQGLVRLGHCLRNEKSGRYRQAGLAIARTLLSDAYLARDANHQGLLLHSIYHRPNNWDHVPQGRKIPCGESSMWGDYHLLELAVYLWRMARGERYLAFFDCAMI